MVSFFACLLPGRSSTAVKGQERGVRQHGQPCSPPSASVLFSPTSVQGRPIIAVERDQSVPVCSQVPKASKISNLHSHLPSSHANLKPPTGMVLSQMLLLPHEHTTDPFSNLQQSPPRLSQPSLLSEFPLRSPGILKARSFAKIIL